MFDHAKAIRRALMTAKSIAAQAGIEAPILRNTGGSVNDLPNLSFDPKEGSGAVPYNADVNYFGMVKHMPVSEFLSIPS